MYYQVVFRQQYLKNNLFHPVYFMKNHVGNTDVGK